MLYSDKEIEIKRKIINIIKTFRSLALLTDSDITITELTKTTNQINMMLLENTTTKQCLIIDLLLIGSYRVYDSISKKFFRRLWYSVS